MEMSIKGATVATFDEADFASSVASALGVDPSTVRILSVTEGSVIVQFAILPSDEEASDLEASVISGVTQKLSAGSIEIQGYGSVAVTAVQAPNGNDVADFPAVIIVCLSLFGALVLAFLVVICRREGALKKDKSLILPEDIERRMLKSYGATDSKRL